MIDQGLLWSMAAMAVAVWITLAIAPPRTTDRRSLVDASIVPVLLGLLGGRVVAMLLDDPRGLGRPADILVLRGGVEFWPAVAIGVVLACVASRREPRSGFAALADSAPAALAGYAAYEAACVARSGCFGPASRLGLSPPGLMSPMVPVGLVVAIAVVGLAAAVRRQTLRDAFGGIVLAVGGLALIRAVASIWLPKIGDGLTRQHVESLLVLIAASFVVPAGWVHRRRSRPREKVA